MPDKYIIVKVPEDLCINAAIDITYESNSDGLLHNIMTDAKEAVELGTDNMDIWPGNVYGVKNDGVKQ